MITSSSSDGSNRALMAAAFARANAVTSLSGSVSLIACNPRRCKHKHAAPLPSSLVLCTWSSAIDCLLINVCRRCAVREAVLARKLIHDLCKTPLMFGVASKMLSAALFS